MQHNITQEMLDPGKTPISLNSFLALYNNAFAAQIRKLSRQDSGCRLRERKTVKEWSEAILGHVMVDIQTNGANRNEHR